LLQFDDLQSRVSVFCTAEKFDRAELLREVMPLWEQPKLLLCVTAMQKLRIVFRRFGTARQEMALE
jgi:hypothetical protein